MCIYIYIHTQTHNGILNIKRNKIVSFEEMWTDLETVIESEVNLKERTIYQRIDVESRS